MKIKHKDKIRVIFIIFIVLVVSLFLVYKIFILLKYPKGNPKNIIYVVSTSGNAEYKVFLRNNEYFDEDYLGVNSSYITSLVDYINIKFNYEYKNNKAVLVSQMNKIEANIIVKSAEADSEKYLWNKAYILKENDLKESASLPIKQSEEVNIDLSYYNNLVNEFANYININVEAYLDVKLTLNFADKNNKSEYYISLNIPLNKESFDILSSNNFNEEEVVYNQKQKENSQIYAQAILYLSILIFINIGNIYIIKNIILKNYSQYSKAKGKILKEYNDKIVTVTNFIKLDNYQIVGVKEFEELIDLSNEAFEPVLFFEKKMNYSKEAWFCILKDKIVYKFVIYSRQFKNKK